MILQLNRKEMEELDLSPLHKYVNWAQYYKNFITGKTGEEHYRLLSYIVKQLPKNSVVIDVGTFVGASAIAMSFQNEHVTVITYDIINLIPTDKPSLHDFPNIKFILKNGLDDIESFLIAPIIMLDIDPHDGIQEELFISRLMKLGYNGIVICDDIHLNVDMEDFWNSITLKKIDVTWYGHWSGTGIIVFNPSFIDIILD